MNNTFFFTPMIADIIIFPIVIVIVAELNEKVYNIKGMEIN